MTILIIIACVVFYLIMGLVSEYMKGYAAPEQQRRSTTRADWNSFLLWFYLFPTTVGDYGAAKRLAAPGN